MNDEDMGDVEPGEDGVVSKVTVPDDVVDALPDQYEGDLDEDDAAEG